MKKLQLLSISVLFLLLSSCASAPKINPLSVLTGNSWELANLVGADLGQFSNGKPTLNFLDGGRLAGYAGCNNFSGGFLLEGANLQLDLGGFGGVHEDLGQLFDGGHRQASDDGKVNNP